MVPTAPGGGTHGAPALKIEPSNPSQGLLEVEDLSVHFEGPHGAVQVVDGLSLRVARGQAVCLVGESGCGKSVSVRAMLGLLPVPPARVRAAAIRLGGRSLLGLSEKERNRVRGRNAGLVFQEPMVALNPVVRVGVQIAEGPRTHLGLSRKQARQRAEELLRAVGIPEPRMRLDAYPHQLSGGMGQRVMLAMALSSDPELLIADEPTTALDVTLQSQILQLLRELRRERNLGLLLITHDLGVVAQVADHVVVLYGGQVLEEAPVEQLYTSPTHPYTRGLLASLPRIEVGPAGSGGRLHSIPGQVPTPGQWPPGCRFAPRCTRAIPACSASDIPLIKLRSGHLVRCLRAREIEAGPPAGSGRPGP